MDRGAWQVTVHGVARVGHDLVTEPPPPVCGTWKNGADEPIHTGQEQRHRCGGWTRGHSGEGGWRELRD